MIRAKLNRNPNARDLRYFGLTILLGFGVIAALAHHSGKHHLAVTAAIISLALGGLGLLWPHGATPFYRIWMGLGLAMGAVTSRIVMAVIFFAVLTPLAIFFRRVLKRDALLLKKMDSKTETYWKDLPPDDKSNYNHLY